MEDNSTIVVLMANVNSIVNLALIKLVLRLSISVKALALITGVSENSDKTKKKRRFSSFDSN